MTIILISLQLPWIGDLRHVGFEIRMNIGLQSLNAQEGCPACTTGTLDENNAH